MRENSIVPLRAFSVGIRIPSRSLMLGLMTTVTQRAGSMKEDIAMREQAWCAAWVAGNVVELERLHDPDYVAINNVGQFSSREQILADVKAGIFRYTSMLHEHVQIRVYGQTAVVNGLTINEGHRGSRDVSGTFAYTRVYLLDHGIWRAVLSQYTRTQ